MLFITHYFILFVVCSSTVVGRISNVFIVVYSHSLCTSVGILRSGIDCLCKQFLCHQPCSCFKKVSHVPVYEYCQHIIIIAPTSEDISIELTSTLSKLLQNTVCGYYYSFKSRTAVSGRCVTTVYASLVPRLPSHTHT